MSFKNIVIALAGVVALSSSALGQAGELVRDKVASRLLGRDVPFTVYLPDGYKASPSSYPVIYLLHGAGGDENEWARKGGAVETLDGQIKRRQMRPAVVVMPTFGPASWYADGAAEKVESAMMEELIPFIEANYKVGNQRAQRAIAGLSMGGYGALNISLHYPERFCAAGIISPAIYDPLPPETSAARRTPQFVRNGQFDAATWTALNYAARLDGYKNGTARVPMWIVAGDHDYLGIALMSAGLYSRMLAIQPTMVELRIVDGDHEWLTFRDALPQTLHYMDTQCNRIGSLN